MNRLIFGCDAEIAQWVSEHIPQIRGREFGPCSAIGIAGNGKLLAGVVYHEYKPAFKTIQISMASVSPMWARRENIYALLHYPFRQLNVFKVWTGTPHDNLRAIRANEHIGFKREAVLAHQFGPKRHAVVMRMLQPDFTRLYENHR